MGSIWEHFGLSLLGVGGLPLSSRGYQPRMLVNATVDKADPTTKHYPARRVRSAEAEEARLVGLSAIYLKAHCVNKLTLR